MLQHLQRLLHAIRINRQEQRDDALQNRQHEPILLRQIVLRAALRLHHECVDLLSQLAQRARVASPGHSAGGVRNQQRRGAVEVVAEHEELQRALPLVVRLRIAASPRDYGQLRGGSARDERELLAGEQLAEESAPAIALLKFFADERGGLSGADDHHLRKTKNRGAHDEEVVAEGGLAENGAVGDAEREPAPEEGQGAEQAGDEEVARLCGGDAVPVEHEAEVQRGEQVPLAQQVLHGLAPAAHDDEVLHEGERRGAARVEVRRAAVQHAAPQPRQLEGFPALPHAAEHRLVRYVEKEKRGNRRWRGACARASPGW